MFGLVMLGWHFECFERNRMNEKFEKFHWKLKMTETLENIVQRQDA